MSRRAVLLLFALVAGVLLPASSVRAVEAVAGTLAGDTVWAPPAEYLVVGDLVVPENVTLTIEAGTRVLFATNHTSDSFPRHEIEVRGTLLVRGAAAAPVLFTSDHPDPTRGDWTSITFRGSHGSVIQHAVLEYAETALDFRSASAFVGNSSILDSALAGISVWDAGSHPVFEDTLISTKTILDIGGGINLNQKAGAILWPAARAEFRRVTFDENLYGMLLQEGSAAVVEDSLLVDGWIGITAVASDLTVRDTRIEDNGFPGYGGTGLNLYSGSTAVLEDVVLEDNGFGAAIEYSSRAAVNAARNVTVNGIALRDVYCVDRHDEALRGVVVDSGRSLGYAGNVSFDGGLVLYDSTNVTFEDVLLDANFRNLWAENSTFALVNSTVRAAAVNVTTRGADVTLKRFSVGRFRNVAYDAASVEVSDQGSTLWVENWVRGRALSHLGPPLPGVSVAVTADGAEVASGTTLADGFSPWLRGIRGYHARDATQAVTRFTAIAPAVEALLAGVAFLDSPRAVDLHAPSTEVFVERDATPPAVASVFPEDGATGVDPASPVRLQFTEAMDTASVEAALTVSGAAVADLVWSDGNRTLTVRLANTDFGRTYVLRVSSEARDVAGNRLDALTVSFTTARAVRELNATQVGLIGGAILLLGLVLAVLSRRSRARDAPREEEGGDGGEGEDDRGERSDGPHDRRPGPPLEGEVARDEERDEGD